MITLSRIIAASFAVGVLGGAVAVTLPAFAGPDRIKFPDGYASRFVSLGGIDRYDSKSVRTVYINPEAFTAFKAGQPLPDGTMLVLEQRPAKLGADGQPALNSEGHFTPEGSIAMVAIQQKKKGWGADIPEAIRNGDWEYAVYDIDGKLRTSANVQPCFTCHKPREKDDFTFMAHRVMSDLKKK
jgi:hypothetical protein